MSVTAVEKIWSGNNGSFVGNDDGTSSGQVVEVLNVFVDDPENDNPMTVRASTLVPQLHASHPGNIYLFVANVDPVRVSPILFTTTVTYKTLSTAGDGNPLNEPAVISYRTIKEIGEIDEDIHGNPLVTANGEKIKGVTRPFSNLVAIVKKNVATFNRQNFDNYIDHIDNSGFLGSTPGTAVLDDVNADPFEFSGFTFYTMVSVVKFRKPVRTTAARAWWFRTLHEGFIVKNDSGELVLAKDENGELESSPVRLKPDGTRETSNTTGHYLEFETLPTVNLTTSGII